MQTALVDKRSVSAMNGEYTIYVYQVIMFSIQHVTTRDLCHGGLHQLRATLIDSSQLMQAFVAKGLE